MVFRLLRKLKNKLRSSNSKQANAGKAPGGGKHPYNISLEYELNPEEEELTRKYPFPEKSLQNLTKEEKAALSETEVKFLARRDQFYTDRRRFDGEQAQDAGMQDA